MASEVQVLPSPLKGGHPPAVKAGGMRISKKQEIGVLERHAKKTGLEKTRIDISRWDMKLIECGSHFKEKWLKITNVKCAIANVAKIQTMDALNDTLEKLNYKFPAIVHMAHQKPRPALEKVTPLKRIYIIQQPRKC